MGEREREVGKSGRERETKEEGGKEDYTLKLQEQFSL